MASVPSGSRYSCDAKQDCDQASAYQEAMHRSLAGVQESLSQQSFSRSFERLQQSLSSLSDSAAQNSGPAVERVRQASTAAATGAKDLAARARPHLETGALALGLLATFAKDRAQALSEAAAPSVAAARQGLAEAVAEGACPIERSPRSPAHVEERTPAASPPRTPRWGAEDVRELDREADLARQEGIAQIVRGADFGFVRYPPQAEAARGAAAVQHFFAPPAGLHQTSARLLQEQHHRFAEAHGFAI